VGLSTCRVTPDYKIGIFCISSKHGALKSNRRVLLDRNQDNDNQLSNMSTRWLYTCCFSDNGELQCSTIKIQLKVLV